MDYFTPNIEDIRVGYEYEEASEGRPGYPEWVKGRIEDFEEALLIIEEKLPRQSIRVPYLSKEQIEAEGWKLGGISGVSGGGRSDNYSISTYDKGKYTLNFKETFYTKSMVIKESGHNNNFYQGECKDINTFRYICKLLNIN